MFQDPTGKRKMKLSRISPSKIFRKSITLKYTEPKLLTSFSLYEAETVAEKSLV